MSTREPALPETAVTERRSSAREGARLTSHELLTVHDVAAMLQVPVSWVYEHTRRGALDELPALKIGKYVRFRHADVLSYLETKRRHTRSLR